MQPQQTSPQMDSYRAGELVFRKAGPADDESLRTLLRNNGMPSWVELAITREPSYFAGEGVTGDSASVLALDDRQPAAVVGMYCCTSMPVHLNGVASNAAYLGGLRVNQSYRHRIRVLKHGFKSIRALLPEHRVFFTSIASENNNSRRLLEAGLPDMPQYRMRGELETLAMATRRAKACGLRPAELQDVPALVDFFNRHAAAWQFSPVLTAEWLLGLSGRHGLHLQDFLLFKRHGRITASLAIWDQRRFKQFVARTYRFPVNALRPAYNFMAAITGRMRLPPVGQPLQQVFLAFPAFDPDTYTSPAEIIDQALALARERGAESAVIGFSVDNPLLQHVKQNFRNHAYRTCIEQVEWPQQQGLLLDRRPAQPEIALL
jgi:hypothetical protein